MDDTLPASPAPDLADAPPLPRKRPTRIALARQKGEPSIEVANLADFPPERIDWVWPGRVAAAKVTTISGDPGVGKSLAAVGVAATVTAGGAWPCGEGRARLGNVVMLSTEAGLADTLRPRIEAAGGDARRVDVMRPLPPGDGGASRCAETLAALEALIAARGGVRVVIIDPASACLRGRIGEIGAGLEASGALAARGRVAVILLVDPATGAALRRLAVSSASVQAAFAAVADPESPSRRLLLPVKSKLGAPAPALGFRLEPRTIAGDIVAPLLAWDAAPVAGVSSAPPCGASRRAVAFLTRVLAGRPAPVREIEAQAIAAGLLAHGQPIADSRRFREAKAALGVRTARAGSGLSVGWVWSLPTPSPVH